MDYQNIFWESKQSKQNSSIERIPIEKPKCTTKAKHNLQLYLDQILKINFPPMRALIIITGHVIYNPAYTYKFQLKTTLEALMILLCISYVILYNFEDTKLIRGHIASVALIGVWTNLTGEFFYYDRKI